MVRAVSSLPRIMGDEWTVVGKKAGGGKRGKKALSLKAAEALNAVHAAAWEAGGGADGDDGDGDATAQTTAVASTEQRIERALVAVRAAPFFRALTAALRRHCHNVAVAAAEAAEGSMDLESDPAPLQEPHGDDWTWAPAPHGVHSLVVYGLGSPIKSSVSCSQLALAELLMREHGLAAVAAAGGAWTYDPVLGAGDRDILQRRGLSVLSTDEAGARAVAHPTLFYMPHCEAVLYDNLLASNWSPTALPRLAILGNSFKTYAERWEFKPADAAGRPKHVLAVLSYCMEVPLGDTGAALVHGFNDTSLLLFPTTRLPAADHPFWLSPS